MYYALQIKNAPHLRHSQHSACQDVKRMTQNVYVELIKPYVMVCKNAKTLLMPDHVFNALRTIIVQIHLLEKFVIIISVHNAILHNQQQVVIKQALLKSAQQEQLEDVFNALLTLTAQPKLHNVIP